MASTAGRGSTTSAMTTAPPSSAIRSAYTRPMPCAPPVTMTTFPFNCMVVTLFLIPLEKGQMHLLSVPALPGPADMLSHDLSRTSSITHAYTFIDATMRGYGNLDFLAAQGAQFRQFLNDLR